MTELKITIIRPAIDLSGQSLSFEKEMQPKVFKAGKKGWYLRDVITIDGKKYVLNFMLYEEKK